MKENEALKIFFNVYEHCSGNIDLINQDYTRILKHQENKFKKFSAQNRYNVLPYLVYSKKNIITLAILNNLHRKSFEIQSNLDLKRFVSNLKSFRNRMNIDVELVYREIESIEDIYTLYVNEEIEFYTFYNLFVYLKFDKKEYLSGRDIIIHKLKHQKRISMLLNFKDYIKDAKYFKDLQKKIDFILV